MRFTVTCPMEVQDELALFWIQSPDRRDAITRASNEIDAILKTAPLLRGEEVGEYRRLTIEPLTVVYTVSPDDCLVRIHRFLYLAS